MIVPVSWFSSEARLRKTLLEVLFIKLSLKTVYGAFTYIQALKWMSCTWLQRLLASHCVCVCALLLSLSPRCRSMEPRGRQTFTSPVCNCATWKKKREKGREHTCRDKSFRCCFSSSFLIMFKEKFLVCVYVECVWLCFCLFFSHQPQTQTWRLESNKSTQSQTSHHRSTTGSNHLFICLFLRAAGFS